MARIVARPRTGQQLLLYGQTAQDEMTIMRMGSITVRSPMVLRTSSHIQTGTEMRTSMSMGSLSTPQVTHWPHLTPQSHYLFRLPCPFLNPKTRLQSHCLPLSASALS